MRNRKHIVKQVDFLRKNVYHISQNIRSLTVIRSFAPLSIGEGLNTLWLNAEKSGIIKVDNFPVREV